MLRSLAQGLAQLHLHSTGSALSRVAVRTLPVQELEAVIPAGYFIQARTTFVLKRKKKVELHKTTGKMRPFRARHYLYEMVEDTNVRKKDPVKVILTKPVEGLGSVGDVVEVKPHRARNHLLLPGLAVYASPENLEKYSNLIETSEIKDQPSSPFALRTAEQLSTRVISLSMNMKNPWQVEPWHVRVAFRKAGIIVPEEALTLPAKPITGPDLDLQDKEFLVKVKINDKEEANVRCRINHYSVNPRERIPWKAFHWEHVAEPIFPEEAEELDALARKNRHTRFPEQEEATM